MIGRDPHGRPDRRRRRRRSDQPVHRRRDPRRPRAHAGARRRRRRLHPQHGDARPPRRARARDRRSRARARRRPARTSSSSRRSASARTRSTSSAPPTCRSSRSCPAAGDEVQALKAGIMEIADIFVVNKADREGADRTVTSIEAMLALQRSPQGEWRPPIVKTEATTGHGRAGAAGDDRAVPGAHRRDAGQPAARPRRVAPARAARRSASSDHVETRVLKPGEFDADRSIGSRRARSIRIRPWTASSSAVVAADSRGSTDR